jgi:hypothetical protein
MILGKYINRQKIILAALFLGALIPRLPTIGAPLAGDEAITFNHYAHLDISTILFNYPDSNQHTLFSILSNICLMIFGDHEVVFRLPSLITGVMAVPLAYYTCRSLGFSQSISVASSLLLSIYIPHIAYSQEGRGYALTVFLALCLVCCSIHVLGRQRMWFWGTSLVISATCIVITLPSNVFFVAGTAGFCWITRIFKKSESSVEQKYHSCYLIPYFLAFFLIAGYLLINMDGLLISAQANSPGELQWRNFQEIAEFLVTPWGFWLYPIFIVGLFSTRRNEIRYGILVLFLIPIFLILVTGIVGFARIYIYFAPFVLTVVVLGIFFLHEKIKPASKNIAHLFLALSFCWLVYQPISLLIDYYPKRMQVGNGYMNDAVKLQEYFRNEPLNILPVIMNAATGRSILIHYIGEDIGKRMNIFSAGKNIVKVLFFCKKGIPPNKYQLQNLLIGTEVPNIGGNVKLVKSFDSFQVFEWDVELIRISPTLKFEDYESQVKVHKFDQAETHLIEKPRAVGKKSLLVKNVSSGFVTLKTSHVFSLRLIKKEGFVLNLFLKPLLHKTFFRTIATNEGASKTLSAYLNPYLNPNQNVFESDLSDFKWETVAILSSTGEGGQALQDIIETNEQSTIIDGVNTYVIKSNNL